MTDIEFEAYKYLTQCSESVLKERLYTVLQRYYDKVINHNDFLYAEGSIPIALVAHLDTVFSSSPTFVSYDKKEQLIYSGQGGIGDDRAGVFAILKLLLKGYHPYIIFTTGEEIGGIGALSITQSLSQPNLKYIIELDRRGSNDCVFYNHYDEEFISYIESFGFEYALGSFSDISIICPLWNIAGVNLSIGYYNEHTTREFVCVDEWEYTITRVEKMLNDVNNAPYYKYNSIIPTKCEKCGKITPFTEPAYVKDKQIYVCWDCLNLTTYCRKCGHSFFPDNLNKKICWECSNDNSRKIKNC